VSFGAAGRFIGDRLRGCRLAACSARRRPIRSSSRTVATLWWNRASSSFTSVATLCWSAARTPARIKLAGAVSSSPAPCSVQVTLRRAARRPSRPIGASDPTSPFPKRRQASRAAGCGRRQMNFGEGAAVVPVSRTGATSCPCCGESSLVGPRRHPTVLHDVVSVAARSRHDGSASPWRSRKEIASS